MFFLCIFQELLMHFFYSFFLNFENRFFLPCTKGLLLLSNTENLWMILIPFLHWSPWQRSQWITVIGQDWFQEFLSNLLKHESADAKMSYKILTAVLGKEEKFHIPEKDINFTGKKKKNGVGMRIKPGWIVSLFERCQNTQAKWNFNLNWAGKKNRQLLEVYPKTCRELEK